jgi:hypothetical protein
MFWFILMCFLLFQVETPCQQIQQTVDDRDTHICSDITDNDTNDKDSNISDNKDTTNNDTNNTTKSSPSSSATSSVVHPITTSSSSHQSQSVNKVTEVSSLGRQSSESLTAICEHEVEEEKIVENASNVNKSEQEHDRLKEDEEAGITVDDFSRDEFEELDK